MMFFRIFSLHPDIFSSFFENSLIARSVQKKVIEYQICNWREKFGVGNYKQVDDQPYGGGSGMVLKVEPIFEALKEFEAISSLFIIPEKPINHYRILPNNQTFWEKCHYSKINPENKKINHVTIHLTPRGFPINQKIVEWLSQDFETINLLCGRYEGFEARVSETVDLELSIGDFVLNGGEVAAMSLIEAISRLVPGFLVKPQSSKHDSFGTELNLYNEQKEYIIGRKNLDNYNISKTNSKKSDLNFSKKSSIDELLFGLDKIDDQKLSLTENLFDNDFYLQKILPKIEHPHYTRPKIWNNYQIPEVLLNGNHKLTQEWRLQNWKKPT